MWAYSSVKILMSALLIWGISSLAKKNSAIGAVLASVPLISVMAILWMYWDNQGVSAIAELSRTIFWLVLPSLIFFLIFPVLLEKNMTFYFALFFSLVLMVLCYFLMIYFLKFFHVKF